MKYGFLFGAGAEIAYKLPSGGFFALDIFRQDTLNPKEKFRKMRDAVEPTTSYASQWLPKDYKTKQIHVFGKPVFQNIIESTVEHRRNQIINVINDFDSVAGRVSDKLSSEGVNVDEAFMMLLGREVSNIHLDQIVQYNENLKNGNKLFESTYFSGLLMV